MWKDRYWRMGLLWAIGLCCFWSYSLWAQPPVELMTKSLGSLHSSPTTSHVFQNNYHANGEWSGRLVLPTSAQLTQSTLTDWVWLEIDHAPGNYQQFIGQILPLTWQPQSAMAADVRQVTTAIQFTPETIASQRQGIIHPQRLNGRAQVGALQSLAGARVIDDVQVKLAGVEIRDGVVWIDREPTQITGGFRGLVKILDIDRSIAAPVATACPGAKPCPSEYFRVQHYNSQTHQFNGPITTIRIPQASARPFGLFPSTVRDLEKSPAGRQGWYVYGDFPVNSKIFTVAALQPRSLLALQPERKITNPEDRLNYFNQQHWQNTPQRQGQLERVGFAPNQTLQLGDRALLIHSFGGIGGKTADIPGVWKTVTGHFAYGIATVVQDDFTGELQWDINYNQVYAHNADGIIAGQQDWATYMGSLERGWSFTRPVADLLIRYPPVTEDYDFDGIQFSPLAEFQRQLHIFAARYRTGDGTGNASVSPAKSCVQDANQALYITIQHLTDRLRSQPQIQTWLMAHPQSAQALRFQKLQALGRELQQALAPLGVVRSDWQANAAKLAGINQNSSFQVSQDPLIALWSWRTMLPRGAQDGIGKIFSHMGADLWFFTTYQIGGVNPDIFPLAPTILFGEIEILSKVVLRLWSGLIAMPTAANCWSALGLLLAYGLIAGGFGWRSGFLCWDYQFKRGLWREGLELFQLLLLPAFIEEILFRLLLLPHPIETATSMEQYRWSIISLVAFIIYHPLNALTFYPVGKPTFMDWRFLTMAGLLGGVCAIAYLTTGSIWPSVAIHWVVVIFWLKCFGGQALLRQHR